MSLPLLSGPFFAFLCFLFFQPPSIAEDKREWMFYSNFNYTAKLKKWNICESSCNNVKLKIITQCKAIYFLTAKLNDPGSSPVWICTTCTKAKSLQQWLGFNFSLWPFATSHLPFLSLHTFLLFFSCCYLIKAIISPPKVSHIVQLLKLVTSKQSDCKDNFPKLL